MISVVTQRTNILKKDFCYSTWKEDSTIPRKHRHNITVIANILQKPNIHHFEDSKKITNFDNTIMFQNAETVHLLENNDRLQ